MMLRWLSSTVTIVLILSVMIVGVLGSILYLEDIIQISSQTRSVLEIVVFVSFIVGVLIIFAQWGDIETLMKAYNEVCNDRETNIILLKRVDQETVDRILKDMALSFFKASHILGEATTNVLLGEGDSLAIETSRECARAVKDRFERSLRAAHVAGHEVRKSYRHYLPPECADETVVGKGAQDLTAAESEAVQVR